MTLFYYYLIFINIYGLFIMYLDKEKSKKGKWRTPEINFFIVSLIGGGLGTLMGMYLFRHKTKHLKFTIIIPLLLIGWIFIMFKIAMF